jgi:hypothetical protein
MLAEEYLRYGVTTIRDAGHTEKWLDVSLPLQRHPQPQFPNLYISGAALISDEERKPYQGHVEVSDASDARKKVWEYHDKGIGQVKIYWRLREADMISVINAAGSLGMNIYGHFDNNVVSIPAAMDHGVVHFEHILTIFKSVFDYKRYWSDFQAEYKSNFGEISFGALTLEIFRYVDSHPELSKELNDLIEEMNDNGASLSTSIHIFGSYVHRAKYETRIQIDMKKGKRYDELTDWQKERLLEDFNILMKYCRIVHEKGIKICIGTDCPDGGQALLSELILLYEAGISMGDILQIATINGADAIDHRDKLGSIEIGNRADIVVFEKSPLDDYMNILSKKAVIKSGKIVFN